MPRAETSQAGRILEFFRSAPLEGAELVLQLAKDAVLQRKRADQPQGAQGNAGSRKGKKAKKRTPSVDGSGAGEAGDAPAAP